MKYPVFIIGLITALAPSHVFGIALDRATFTEVVNDVRVIERKSRETFPARLRTEFRSPDVLRTGPDSRAELTSRDDTVTRVGSNTLFSFQPDSREVDLQKGSILFHSPSGKGGGTIRTSAASAAVLGTTLIVSATTGGAMKVLLLEGLGKVTTRDGKTVTLRPGQMTIVMPGGRTSPVLDFQLSRQIAGSLLVKGFRSALASEGQIRQSIRGQERQLKDGTLGEKRGPEKMPPPPRGREGAPPPPPPPPQIGLPIGPQQGAGPLNVQTMDGSKVNAPQKTPPPPPPKRPSGGNNQR